MDKAVLEINELFKDKNINSLSGEVMALDVAFRESGRSLEDLKLRQNTTLSAYVGMPVYIDDKTGEEYYGEKLSEYRWNHLSEDEKRAVASLYGDNPYRGNAFAVGVHEVEKMASAMAEGMNKWTRTELQYIKQADATHKLVEVPVPVAARIAGTAASGLLFSPYLGIASPIAKATTGQDVTPMEWANLAATAAINFLMLGGANAIGH